jgi:integrase/recombinase XerC
MSHLPAPRTSTPAALQTVITLWADHVTDPASPRRRDLLRDKTKAALDFFEFAGRPPAAVGPVEVKNWQAELEAQGLATSTIYAKISRVSSFYNWAIEAGHVERNPVDEARPRAPRPYQSESTQSLSDDDVARLLEVVRERDDLVGRRDYAMLTLYFFSGKRRREIVQLRAGDVRIKGEKLIIRSQVKGGDYEAFEVDNPLAVEALAAYLARRGVSLADLAEDAPLWVVSRKAGKYAGRAISSHGFVANLKRYARAAGLGDIHLHQTRHTFARWVGEESGSLQEAQAALGHRNVGTTRVYLPRVAVKKDHYSQKISERLGL